MKANHGEEAGKRGGLCAGYKKKKKITLNQAIKSLYYLKPF